MFCSHILIAKISLPITKYLIIIITCFLLVIISHHGTIITAAAADQNKSSTTVVGIGVIMDVESRIGKEVKTAMNMAVQSYSSTDGHSFSLHYRRPGSNPLGTANAGNLLLITHIAS